MCLWFWHWLEIRPRMMRVSPCLRGLRWSFWWWWDEWWKILKGNRHLAGGLGITRVQSSLSSIMQQLAALQQILQRLTTICSMRLCAGIKLIWFLWESMQYRSLKFTRHECSKIYYRRVGLKSLRIFLVYPLSKSKPRPTTYWKHKAHKAIIIFQILTGYE